MFERDENNRVKFTFKQIQFLQSKKRTVIYRGGIRSGKTVVLCFKAIEYAGKGLRFCIVSFSYPILRDVCMFTMRDMLRDLQIPYEEKITDKVFVVSGMEILFRSGDQPDTLRGLSLDGFGIDEAREFKTRDIYDIMIGRLSNNPHAQGYITTSPKGKNWVNALEGLPDTETIIQRTEENPFLPPEYIASLRSQYTTEFQRQELDADIVEFNAGVINSLWFNIVDYIKPRQAVRFWDLAVSIKNYSDRSSGALCSFQNDKFLINNIKCGLFEYPDLRKLIIKTAQEDGEGVIVAVEDAGQQRGFIDDLKQLPELRAYQIRAVRPEGDKFNRAMPWASRAQLGGVNVCCGTWNADFFDECNSFTANDTHEHDDQIDSVSGAYKVLQTINFTIKLIHDSKIVVSDQKLPDPYQVLNAFSMQENKASVITCQWDSEAGRLHVNYEALMDTIESMVEYVLSVKGSKNIAPPIMDSDAARTVLTSLRDRGIRLEIDESYDALASVYFINSLIDKRQFTINSQCKNLLLSMQNDTEIKSTSPYLTALLYVVNNARLKYKPHERKPFRPFERAKYEYQEQQTKLLRGDVNEEANAPGW